MRTRIDQICRLSLFLGIAVVSACSPDSPTAVNAVANIQASNVTPIMDQHEHDPCPTCNGIFLTGSATNFAYCVESPNIDQDLDHVDDNCEWLLAQAFAPLIYMSPTDNCPIGEPYFAAHRDPDLSNHIDIMYLLSYHTDCGTLGHNGDSEWVIVRVYNNLTTGRWELSSVTLSAHWNTGNDQTATYYQYEIWYPAQDGTSRNWGQSLKYPEVYASRGKHANYRDRGECHYFFSGDDCSDNVPYGRVGVDYSKNIGSRVHPFVDCVTSMYPGSVGWECFWTGSSFRGWQNSGGDTPYSDILAAHDW